MATAERSAMSVRRERRRAELDRPDTRTAILEATERQLENSSLHELSVERILEEADVSRGSFYSYFESKYDVAGALLAKVMEEMYELWRPYVERDEDADPEEVLRTVLRNAVTLWSENRPIARLMHEYWHSVPEIGDQWLAAMDRFTTGVAAELDRDRKAGLAPAGGKSREIAAAALWSTEQLLFVGGTDGAADLTGEDAIFETLMSLWTGLLYGRQPKQVGPDA